MEGKHGGEGKVRRAGKQLRALPSRLILRPHMALVLGNGLPDPCCHECQELETGGKERQVMNANDDGTLKSRKDMQSVRSQCKETDYQGLSRMGAQL